MNVSLKLAIAGAAIAAAALGFAPTGRAADLCLSANGMDVCVDSRGSYDRVAFEDASGNWGLFDVTCTDTNWILHSGAQGNVTQSTMNQAAADYCDGRGSMF